MQNYIKSNVEGTQINTNQTNTNNPNSVNMSGLQTEVMDFNSNGTINTTPKKITSINLNATKSDSTYKSFEELCLMYGGKTFSNEAVASMYSNKYASKGMIINYMKSGYIDKSALKYLLENNVIDIDTAEYMSIAVFNQIRQPNSGMGNLPNSELYLAQRDDGKTVSFGNNAFEYSQKIESNGVTKYYDEEGDIILINSPGKSECLKTNETFYILDPDNYRLERTYTQLTNEYSLNPSYKKIKEVINYHSNNTESCEYIDEETGYSISQSRASLDNQNGDAFYTIKQDGKVIAGKYGTGDDRYSFVLDGDALKDYKKSYNYATNGFDNINLTEEEFNSNYNTIKEMSQSGISSEKTTTWCDGKEYTYSFKDELADGSVLYNLENGAGAKTLYTNGEVGITIPRLNEDGSFSRTIATEVVYKTYSDGSYSVRNEDFMVKYNKDGYDLYTYYADGSSIFEKHYDYYRG